jgi:hypothetical protein
MTRHWPRGAVIQRQRDRLMIGVDIEIGIGTPSILTHHCTIVHKGRSGKMGLYTCLRAAAG